VHPIDRQTPLGLSPLHCALALGNAATAARLLCLGASPHLADSHGSTALHHAARSSDPRCVLAVLRAGGDKSARDNRGRTPFEVRREPIDKSGSGGGGGAGGAAAGTSSGSSSATATAAGLGSKRGSSGNLIGGGDAAGPTGASSGAPLYTGQAMSRAPGNGALGGGIGGMIVRWRDNADRDPEAQPLTVEWLLAPEDASGGELAAALGSAGAGGGHGRLHAAVRHGDLDLLRRLLRSGAQVAHADHGGNPALHVAADCGAVEAAVMLLDAGASVNATGRLGTTALHVAAAGINARAKENAKAAGALAQRSAEAIESDNASDASSSVDSDESDNKGSSANAAGEALLSLLLTRGADVAARADGGFAPLHFAAGCGNAAAVAVLLRSGAEVNVCDDLGHTPLHHAAQARAIECIDALLAGGADKDARTKDGVTPFGLCIARGDSDIAGRLVRWGIDGADKSAPGSAWRAGLCFYQFCCPYPNDCFFSYSYFG
jgi:ankyrin repeat protein